MPVLRAENTDIPELNKLVNLAYRGETSKNGWTTEANLLDGKRIDEPTLGYYFKNQAVTILKNVDDNGVITGCVYLEKRDEKLYLGMLSVNPLKQNKGTGRLLLSAAEDLALKYGIRTVMMTVISVRHELISWYERRGYMLTGEIQAFNHDKKFGVPKQPIELAVLEKQL